MRHLQAGGEARFVTGNIVRHVVVMAGTGAVGLMAVFAVDLLNLFYISLLGQRPIAAAVEFAGVIGFFQTSVLIGLTIGTSAVVARSIGAGAARVSDRSSRRMPVLEDSTVCARHYVIALSLYWRPCS